MKSDLIKKEFGKLFRSKRLCKDLTQNELSKRIGVSKRTLINWEKGNTFIEDLSLICIIDELIDAYIPNMLDLAIQSIKKKYPNKK